MDKHGFPTDVQEFDADDRISFSKLDQKFIAVHDDGTEFEFDADHKQWLPLEDDGEDGENGETNTPVAAQDASVGMRRRHDEAEANGQQVGTRCANEECATKFANISKENPKPNRPSKKQKAPPPPRQNTAVYVRGLPLDATIDEIHEVFSRKGGVIAEEIDSGAPRIKMYTDDDGNFKGDALVVFFKPQSVQMAVMLLDDTDFRITATGTKDGRISVEEADSSYKKMNYNQEGGETHSDKPAQAKKQSASDRQKIIKKTQKMAAKLADWDDDESPLPPPGMNSKKDKTVVLVHMFTLQELEEDPAALLEIKEDIRDECSKLGAVTSVVLYDEEEDGIVTVKFQDSESALACIKTMHGRAFDGRTVEASLATGKEKFRKSKDNHDGDSD